MARTALLRSLKRLAKDHHQADALGISPAELRERAAAGGYSRRDVLKRGGALGAAAALGPGALARTAVAATGSSPRIAIVGGGIAGLNAALTLQDKGLASTVYEAGPAIGGRMHSDRSGYWSNGQISEFCGELIDTNHTVMQSLAKRFALPLVDLHAAEPAGSTPSYWFLGSRYTTAQADADFGPVRDAAKRDLTAAGYPTLFNSYKQAGWDLDHMSVYDWIETRVPGGHGSPLGRLLDAAYNEEYGAETTDQSALNILYLIAYQPSPQGFEVYGVSDERYHVAGGNQQLPEAIASTLPDVRTGWRLSAVARNGDGTLTLTFSTPSGGATVVADQVVLTVPFTVLRGLDYTRAGFDDLKKTAITQLGGGRNAKLQLQFASRLWNTSGPWGISTGDTYTDLGFQNTWDVTRAQAGATGILVNYAGGDVAGAYSPATPYSNAAQNPKVATYARSFLSKLEVVFPGITKQWNGKATLSTPFLDPNLLCSYSYWRVGQYTQFSGYEGAAQGAIHFAGEHCSQDFQGFMEGGAREGGRAALEVYHALTGR
ncbi:MAG: monoamine oxidase [Solirubrobacteraceae bacterium]|nr:monoamine oxidase [Solirubrobacteraceae bacterium]